MGADSRVPTAIHALVGLQTAFGWQAGPGFVPRMEALTHIHGHAFKGCLDLMECSTGWFCEGFGQGCEGSDGISTLLGNVDAPAVTKQFEARGPRVRIPLTGRKRHLVQESDDEVQVCMCSDHPVDCREGEKTVTNATYTILLTSMGG